MEYIIKFTEESPINDCNCCPLQYKNYYDGDYYCIFYHHGLSIPSDGNRPEWCPLIEVGEGE